MRKKVLGLLRRKRGGLKKRFMFDENGNKLLFLTPRNFQGAELYYFCSLLKMYAFIMQNLGRMLYFANFTTCSTTGKDGKKDDKDKGKINQ